jgi:pilus assembly protein CpaE
MAAPLISKVSDGAPDFLALVADDVTRETVRHVAAQFGWPQSRVREGGVAAAVAQLRAAGGAPRVLLVDVSGSDEALADMDRLADVCEPHTRVVALGVTNDVSLYRELLRMGVSEYLVKPVSADALGEALRRADRTERPAKPATKPARTLAFVGARGGVGTTSLAVSLGWGLAHEQQLRTVLLDLDLQFGSMALSLDLEPGRGLREILSNPDRIDSLLIGSATTQQSERLRILGAEESLDGEIEVGTDALEALTSALAETADAIVVDVPRRLDTLGREALAQTDVVCLITDLSLPAMRDTQRLLTLLRKTRGDGEVLIVGNRVGGVAGEVPQAEFERAVGAKLDFAMPFDAKAATAAAEQGKPLLATARPGPLAAELRRLATYLAGGDGDDVVQPEKPAWLKRLIGK